MRQACGLPTAGADSAIGWCEGPAPSRTARWAVELVPNAARATRFVLSSHPLPASRLAAWAARPHAARAAAARRWWTRETSRGARFELNDPAVEAAVRAARVVLLSCRERRGGRDVPLGNPFQYRDVWIRDGARAVQALALHGYVPEARRLARCFRELQCHFQRRQFLL